MSETCFTHCVDNFNTRNLDVNEEKCLERCMGKYVSFNHRILAIYVEAQQKIMKKRSEELALNNETVAEINSNNNQTSLETTDEIKA